MASAPGEAPAIDYGHLLNSLGSSILESDGNSATAQLGTNAEYAAPLEFGSAHTAARPFMRPAADEHGDDVSRAMSATAVRLVKQAGGS